MLPPPPPGYVYGETVKGPSGLSAVITLPPRKTAVVEPVELDALGYKSAAGLMSCTGKLGFAVQSKGPEGEADTPCAVYSVDQRLLWL